MRIVILLLICSQISFGQRIKYNLKDSLRNLFVSECKQHQFSGVLLVAKDGKPIYFSTYGKRDYAKGGTINKSTIFELASVSKQFTAMIIMMLQERGKLGFDDKLDHWIPGLPFKGVTIRHMLNHTSGLPDYQGIMDKYWDKSKVADNIDAIEYLKKYPEPLHFSPGEKYEYSNTGYLLLASVAEKAADMNFIKLLQDWIFKPLKMEQADMRSNELKNKTVNFARGHIYNKAENKFVNAAADVSSNYTIWLGNRKGPGRISANAFDLLKWDQALYTPALVAKTTLLEAFKPAALNNGQLSNYGFGWEIAMHDKLGRVVSHSGDNPGYKTHIHRYIDQNYTIILLNNTATARFDIFLNKIDQLITNKLIFDNADGSMDPLRRRE